MYIYIYRVFPTGGNGVRVTPTYKLFTIVDSTPAPTKFLSPHH